MSEEQQQTNEQQSASEPIIERPGVRAIPDATETRRQEITRHPDWFSNGPQKAALMAEMQRLADPSVAARDQARPIRSRRSPPPSSASRRRTRTWLSGTRSTRTTKRRRRK